MLTVLNLLWQIPLAMAWLAVGVWGIGALYYRAPRPARLWAALWALYWPLAGLYALLFQAIIGWAATLIALTLLMAWWQRIRPAHHRHWAADVSRLLHVERNGSQARLYNVRHFDWRTRLDFTQRWETRSYDIDQIVSTDLVCSYWMGPTIAHTLVSFGFADGRRLVFSVEVRRLAGEKFSAIGGLFRQCELVIVAADERDIIRTRSNVRGEDVYLFPVALPRDEARALFCAYLEQAEALIDTPRFYNTLTSNCTTLIYDMIRRIHPGIAWDYRLLASGYLPDYLYELRALPMQCTLAELRRRGHINARALASDPLETSGTTDQASPDFSHAIRQGIPTLDTRAVPPG